MWVCERVCVRERESVCGVGVCVCGVCERERVCMCVCVSAWNNSALTGRIFMKFDI